MKENYQINERAIPEPNSGCLIWVGHVNEDGYGRTSFNGKLKFAHRQAFENHNGVSLNRDQKILHKCDVRCCVNPLHLYIGTMADNMEDMVKRGRAYKKLDFEKVKGIYLSDGLLKDVAREYGVAVSLVSMIKRGLTWGHITKSL